MKIGVSSQNFRTITGHAGKARRFFVYEQQVDDIQELERINLPKEMSMHEYKGEDHPIYKLDILITASCGGGFINRMASHDVQVITTSDTDPKVAVEKIIGRGCTFFSFPSRALATHKGLTGAKLKKKYFFYKSQFL